MEEEGRREREAKFFENSGLSDACLAVAM